PSSTEGLFRTIRVSVAEVTPHPSQYRAAPARGGSGPVAVSGPAAAERFRRPTSGVVAVLAVPGAQPDATSTPPVPLVASKVWRSLAAPAGGRLGGGATGGGVPGRLRRFAGRPRGTARGPTVRLPR